MATVVFNPQLFVQRYPEFNTLDAALLQLYFSEATLYCRNDGGGPVSDLPTLTMFLNMLTAHIAAQIAAPPPARTAVPPAGGQSLG